MKVGKLGSVPYLFIEIAVKQTGTFDPEKVMPVIEQNLTPEAYDEIKAFLSWLHTNGRTIGHGNYEAVYAEYKTAETEIIGQFVDHLRTPKKCKGIFVGQSCPNNADAVDGRDYCAECWNAGEDLCREAEATELADEGKFFDEEPEEMDEGYLPHWHGNRDSDEPFNDEPPEPDTWLQEPDSDSLIGPPNEDFN